MLTAKQKEAINTVCALCLEELGHCLNCSNCPVRWLEEPEERPEKKK